MAKHSLFRFVVEGLSSYGIYLRFHSFGLSWSLRALATKEDIKNTVFQPKNSVYYFSLCCNLVCMSYYIVLRLIWRILVCCIGHMVVKPDTISGNWKAWYISSGKGWGIYWLVCLVTTLFGVVV